MTGDGLVEGLDWLSEKLKVRSRDLPLLPSLPPSLPYLSFSFQRTYPSFSPSLPPSLPSSQEVGSHTHHGIRHDDTIQPAA